MSNSPQPPPEPDKARFPSYIGNETLEAHYSKDARQRAVLTRDGEGLLRVRLERWVVYDWGTERAWAGWLPVGTRATITDTLDNARRLAQERLVELEQSLGGSDGSDV